jgi:uncharacterized protein
MSKPTFLDPLIGKGAGQCELVNAERGVVLAALVEPAFDSKARKKGLLGRESLPGDYALVIAPCSAVHTFFMRMPIDMVFVSRNGTITRTCRSVKPWRIAGSLTAYAVIEAAAGFIDRLEILPGEAVELREIPHRRRATDVLLAPSPAYNTTPGAESGRRPTSQRRVSLADIIARKTPLAWFEGTAIVQELCDTVLARGPADDLRIPELKHIVLTGDGKVTVIADGPAGHSPVQRAGLVLLALTPDPQLPMQLRLLILEELSPRTKLSSLQDLHRELEFFERPDRQAIVREVYERFHEEPPLAPTVPTPLLEPPLPKHHHLWWRRKGVWVGGTVVLAAAVVAAMTWAWPRPEGQWMRANARQLSQASLAAGRIAIQAVRHEVTAAKSRLGRPRQPEPVVPLLADTTPSARLEPGSGVRQDGGVPAPALPPFELVPTPPIGAEGPKPAASAPGAGTPTPTPEPLSGSVFSAADSKVVPPKRIWPSFRSDSPPGARTERPPELELVVSPSGEVESVRLVSRQATALSGMQISAVKAWRYASATLDGQPVRYRLRVKLPAQ